MDGSAGGCIFIAKVDTWGFGGQPADIVGLTDGSVLVITETAVVLYESLAAFEADAGARVVSRRF